ncbi:TPA: Fis family transcriptional regulator [Acinetobacter baumannii]|nr:Fis family transcriptional regulator [Acinetobacter baumannii]
MNIILTETDLDIALEAGDSYRDILDHVAYLLIDKALIKSRGSKAQAATMLKMNRGTLNKVLIRAKAKKEANRG